MSIKAYSDFKVSQKSDVGHNSYDVHGNVKELWQDFKKLEVGSQESEAGGERFKHISYKYDIISNKVKEVAYQKGQPDQLLHRYKYDANNRLREVLTSSDGVLWDRDAKYLYYLHGPLARLELGELQVQGTDYVYTINGWVKGVNSATLMANRDVGRDGNEQLPNLHRWFGRDAFGFALHYHEGDYKAVSAVQNQTANSFYSHGLSFSSLYNGNIGAMQLAMPGFSPLPSGGVGGGLPDAFLYSYKYDQLNRFMEQKAYRGIKITMSNIWTGIQPTEDYSMKMRYDANGNILSMIRNGVSPALNMDALNYRYFSNNNRLQWVNDLVPSLNYPDDIDDQQKYNYTYDATGNLTSDKSEEIEKIDWYVNGKVKSIRRKAGSVKPELYFEYAPDGQRVLKAVINGTDTVKQYYVRDVSGNIMGIYEQGMSKAQGKGFKPSPYYKLLEQPLYGSSRLGVVKRDLYLMGYGDVPKPVSGDDLLKKIGAGAGKTQGGKPVLPVLPVEGKPGKIEEYKSLRGRKLYELVSHRGDVQVVVSDRKIAHSTNGVDVDWFVGDVISLNGMYPGGMPEPGRSFQTQKYRFGHNTQEKVDEISGKGNHYTAEFWEYDARTIRRWNLDSKPDVSISLYNCFAGNPIWFSDPDGQIPFPINKKFKGQGFRIDSWFGARNTGLSYASKDHKGLDINFGSGKFDYGAPVLATHTGTASVDDDPAGKSGRSITITSPDNSFRTKYFHLKKINIKEGAQIGEGNQIGEIGGSAMGKELGGQVHLHYQIEKYNSKTKSWNPYDPTEGKGKSKEKVVDPQKWIKALNYKFTTEFKLDKEELVMPQDNTRVDKNSYKIK